MQRLTLSWCSERWKTLDAVECARLHVSTHIFNARRDWSRCGPRRPVALGAGWGCLKRAGHARQLTRGAFGGYTERP